MEDLLAYIHGSNRKITSDSNMYNNALLLINREYLFTSNKYKGNSLICTSDERKLPTSVFPLKLLSYITSP